jgi:hypothetical protein
MMALETLGNIMHAIEGAGVLTVGLLAAAAARAKAARQN